MPSHWTPQQDHLAPQPGLRVLSPGSQDTSVKFAVLAAVVVRGGGGSSDAIIARLDNILP